MKLTQGLYVDPDVLYSQFFLHRHHMASVLMAFVALKLILVKCVLELSDMIYISVTNVLYVIYYCLQNFVRANLHCTCVA